MGPDSTAAHAADRSDDDRFRQAYPAPAPDSYAPRPASDSRASSHPPAVQYYRDSADAPVENPEATNRVPRRLPLGAQYY